LRQVQKEKVEAKASTFQFNQKTTTVRNAKALLIYRLLFDYKKGPGGNNICLKWSNAVPVCAIFIKQNVKELNGVMVM
jgi:hypothetical protein